MSWESAKTSEIKEILQEALPAVMDGKQQARKVSNILQSMKRDGIADVTAESIPLRGG